MNPISYTAALFQWLISGWGLDSNTPGIMILAVSAWLIWLKKEQLKQAPKEKDLTGLIIIVFCAAAFTAGCVMRHPLPGITSIIVLLWAVPFFIWGGTVAELVFFPCAYLLFAVPGLLASIVDPLKIISTVASAGISEGLGIELFREGNMVTVPGAENVVLNIADECSGVRSFITLTALAAAYSYVTQESIINRWILFLAAMPIAIAGNIVRCTSIIIAAHALGHDIAINYFHTFAPRVIFVMNVLIIVVLGERLQRTSASSGSEAAVGAAL